MDKFEIYSIYRKENTPEFRYSKDQGDEDNPKGYYMFCSDIQCNDCKIQAPCEKYDPDFIPIFTPEEIEILKIQYPEDFI